MEVQQVPDDQVVPNQQQLRLLRRMRLEIFDAVQGMRIAYANDDERFNPGRIGGFFQIDIPRNNNWRNTWLKIYRATKRGKLGYKSSIPTCWRNQDFAGRFNRDPRKYPIWVHTSDSSDMLDLGRVYKKLMEMGISTNWIHYRSYYEKDARDNQFGSRLDMRR